MRSHGIAMSQQVYNLAVAYADVSAGFIGESRKTLAASMGRIEHCLSQLTDEQVWWRPHPSMNAIGNLLLHLAGNLGQWVVQGATGQPDRRDRQSEFDQRDPIPAARLLASLRQVVADADQALASLDAPGLLAPRRIQAFDTCVIAAVYHAVSHFEGHAQEIICMTRMQLGDRYRFLWTPTPAQGGRKEASP